MHSLSTKAGVFPPLERPRAWASRLDVARGPRVRRSLGSARPARLLGGMSKRWLPGIKGLGGGYRVGAGEEGEGKEELTPTAPPRGLEKEGSGRGLGGRGFGSASRVRQTIARALPSRRMGLPREKMKPRVSQIASPSSRRFYEQDKGYQGGKRKRLGSGLHGMFRKNSVLGGERKSEIGVLDRFLRTRLARPDDDHETEWLDKGRSEAASKAGGRRFGGLYTQCLIAEDATAHLVWDVVVALFVLFFVAVAPIRAGKG